MGKRRRRARQSTMWVATADLPKSAGHPFYERLNRTLDEAGFDAFFEAQCAAFYADGVGRPSLAPGRYFRLLLLGYFEGLDSERAIAWRAADSLSIREFLDFALHEAPPDHSTAVAHPAPDRPRDAPGRVHVGVAASGRRPPRPGVHDRDRCDDAGSQRGDAKHRAPGHGRGVRRVADPTGRGLRHRDADARAPSWPASTGHARRRGRTTTGRTRTIPTRRSRR